MRAIRPTNSLSTVGGLALICTRDEEAVELSLHGELNIGTAPHLERAVTSFIGAELDAIVLDIGPLGFVDLVGVRALLAISDRCAANGVDLRFRGIASSQVVRVFSLVGADELLGID